ncbi:MAG: sigma-70 family polymerase sigma factor, partial [Akkermansiaceae bacterium]|nr:sigma-70 family polymerase sigma factor [Akkermansiaceae bacterium]
SLAIVLVRAEARRKKLELSHAALAMSGPPQNSPSWAVLAPVIDELIDALPAADREVILLRYYDHRSLGSIGRQLGLTEDTAGKRAARALQRLRTLLGRRGIATSIAALETLLPAQAATAPASQTLTLSILSATRDIAPVVPGFFTTALLTMTTKTITTTAGAAIAVLVLGSAAYLTTTHHTPGGKPDETAGPALVSTPGPKAGGSVPSSGPATSSPSSVRPPRGKPAPSVSAAPGGIDPAIWRAAGEMLEHMADGRFLINNAATLPPEKLQQLKGVLGLDDPAVASISDLISGHLDAQEKRSSDFLRQQLAASTDLQELFALNEVGKAGNMSPEQEARRNDLGGRYADIFSDFQSKQVPWYEDSAFLDDVKGKLQPGQATGFDSFVQEQGDAIHEAQAFDKSQELSTQLNLDKDQRQAIYQEISNNNDTLEAIGAHLSPEQLELYKKIRNGKSFSISSH